MKKVLPILITALILTVFNGCSSEADISKIELNGEVMHSSKLNSSISSITANISKTEGNPILSNIFCADPTAVEYEGRLYVYGTNDQQQCDETSTETANTYEHIKSLVMISTDDMVNWTYHGTINVNEIAPWIIASWAPSIVSRVEEDGLTHFYLYFSNSGWGTGVLTSTSPTGPWIDPLGKSLIDGNTTGLNGCNSPFDPGAVIDDNGTGWLAFGGGENSARIVKLGADMISLDSEIVKIPNYFHFEASELNYINGTYVYTYNLDWDSHYSWDQTNKRIAPACSMAYMTTTTPLVSDSWEYGDYYFKNPGEQGLEYSNNHTHLQKYNDKWYLFYHSLFPQKNMGATGGFRSLCVNEAVVDEKSVTISEATATKQGVSQIKNVDAYAVNQAETAYIAADIAYTKLAEGNLSITSKSQNDTAAFVCVKGVDFGKGANAFAANVKGSGRVEIRLDSIDSEPAAAIEYDAAEFTAVYNEIKKINSVHDVYIILSAGVEIDSWQFTM